MGAISYSIDRELVEAIQKVLQARTFVETGTSEGDSVARIKDLFETVFTVDSSKAYYDASSQRFRDDANVHIAFGDSAEFLRKVRDKVSNSAIFWLDAHWCLADTNSGEQSESPLIAELEAIGSIGLGSVVIIDDARLYVAPPPKPHEISQWPTFSQLLQHLTKLSTQHLLTIVNDVIIFYPPMLDAPLRAYSHDHSVDWLHITQELQAYKSAFESERTAAAERLELLEKSTAENERLRSSIGELAERSTALENEAAALREHLETERSAAAERLELLQNASAELQRQIQHSTERASIIDSLTDMVEKQQRVIDRGERP